MSFNTRLGPKNVVSGVSFSIGPGETLGLVGESGSGKSVTALTIMGLLSRRETSTTGSVRLGATELIDCSPRQLRDVRGVEMAMIFQDPSSSLNPALTIGTQIVETIRANQHVSRTHAEAKAIELIGRVGVPAPRLRMRSYPHELSGGMCQRVMIAMALSCGPRFLIADEPTTALDVTVQAQVLDLLRSLQTEMEMSMLFISHDLAVIADCADRVAVMYSGEIVEEADVFALYRRPRHPYTEALLESTPDLTRTRQHGATREPSPRTAPGGEGCRFGNRCRYVVDACLESPIELSEHAGNLVRCRRAAELTLIGAS